jgi:hypothetical protein
MQSELERGNTVEISGYEEQGILLRLVDNNGNDSEKPTRAVVWIAKSKALLSIKIDLVSLAGVQIKTKINKPPEIRKVPI